MKLKRAKQYRKLLQQYSLAFGFREPYQVLVDAQFIQDCEKFKMPLARSLENTLSAKVKPLVTQCSIRHLYTLQEIPRPTKDSLIAVAKSLERRRCNHHLLDEPLTTLECFRDIIDPKQSHTNPHRYVVASQEEDVRRYCRSVQGVPLVYVKRSVMIMEPMSEDTAKLKERMDKSKFRDGLRRNTAAVTGKRKEREDNIAEMDLKGGSKAEADDNVPSKKAKIRGPKGPNPLSVKKPKKSAFALGSLEHSVPQQTVGVPLPSTSIGSNISDAHDTAIVTADGRRDSSSKRKRKRKVRDIDVLGTVDSDQREMQG